MNFVPPTDAVEDKVGFVPPKDIAQEFTPPSDAVTTSTTAPVTGETGAAFGMYPKPAATKPKLPIVPAQKEEPFTPRDFTALDTAIQSITPKASPSVTAPVTGEGGAAFGMVPKQKFGGHTTGITEEMAAKSPEVLSFTAEYLKTRMPNKPLAKDPVQIMRDFKDFMQKDTADTVREYTWASNATPKQRELAVKAYDLADKMQVSMEEHAVSALKDPYNYIGLGAGWAVKQTALRSSQAVAKAQIKAAIATAATEGVVAGGQNVLQQKTNIKLGMQKDFSYAATAAAVGLGIAFEGAAVSKAGKAIGGQKSIPQRLDDLRAAKATSQGVDVDAWLDQFTAREKEVVGKPAPLYESPEARATARKESIDKIDMPTDMTESVLSKPIITDIFNVAKQLFKDNPDLRPDLNEVRTVQGIVNALNVADEDMIQQAALRAGVKPADFLEAFKVQASEAGAFLQQAKSTADLLRKMAKGDPDLEDAFKKMLNAGAGTTYLSGTVLEGVKKGTAASVAASTAGLSTAVFNAIGAAGTMSIKAAGDTLESVYRVSGRMLNDLRGNGAPITSTRIKEDVGEIFADGGYVLSRLLDAGYTKELSELALKNNPRLNNLINNVGAEVDLQGAPELLQVINTFNRAVDGVVRAPVFVQSIRDRMKDVGLDFDEFIASDKAVPVSLLQAAAEDTMKLTFSYNFKKTGEKSIEGMAEDLAFDVLQKVNNNAGLGILKDLALPFVRFNLNAMRYTYRMTPISGVAGYQELKQAAKLREEGKFMEAAGVAYDGKRKVLDATVGTAAIGTAAWLMDEDIQFYQYRDKEGNVKDMSGLFPVVNIKALGAATRFMKDVGKSLWYTASMTPEERIKEANTIKAEADKLDANDPKRQQLINQYELLGLNRIRNFDGAKMMEVVTGMGRQAGVQKTVFEIVGQAIEGGITESMERKAGQAVGGFVSRFDNVLNPVYDLINFMTEDNRVVDPRASTTSETLQKAGPFAEAAVANVIAPIPGARDVLTERPSLFQTTQQQAPAVVRQFTGERATPPTTFVENEFARLNMPTYKAVSTMGDRDYDNVRIAMARGEFINNATRTINDPVYKQKSANNQQLELKKAVEQALKNTAEQARDYFIAAKGEAAIDALYQKAKNKDAQEDNFMQQFKRRPTTMIDKMMIIEGEFDTAGEVSKLAVGGFLSKQLTKAMTKAAPIEKIAAEAVEDVVTKATTKEVVTPKADVFNQMSNVLTGKPAAKTPPAPAKKPLLSEQTEQAIPAPTPKEEIAPTPSNAFTEDDYKLGEALMRESGYTDEMMQKMKKSDYNSYMNEVHLFTGTAKGIKYKDIPPSPFKKEKVTDEITGDIEYDINGNEISVNGVPVKPSTGASEMIDDAFEDVVIPEVDTSKMVKGAQTGHVEQSIDWIDPEDSSMAAQRKYVKQRNTVLSDIKQLRTAEFSKMRKDPAFDMFDDEVLAVLQGDFRKKFDREFDVATDKDAGVVMATRYQQKLDELREMYKDVPPKKLWHGNISEKIEPVKKKGFADPQTKKNFHQELYVGAPSFTSDLNLNMGAESFGGMNPSNILYTEIPYAEYVFTRINMKPEAYDAKDLSAIAQSINGSPNVARAVSLPRAGYFEKESMMPEANKLRLKSAAKDVESAINASGMNPEVYNERIKQMDNVVANAIKSGNPADAYTAYGAIREMMNVISNMSSNTSVKGGRGHQSASKLNTFTGFSDKYNKVPKFNKIADILEKNGAKQKAETLRTFSSSLSEYGDLVGGTAVEEAARINKLNDVIKASEKLAKGGFVAKRY